MEESSGLEETVAGLRIRAPRPEDAGLEDCALSPSSIMQAFSRAASSLKSRVTVPSSTADGCVQDPGPTDGHVSDSLVGGSHVPGPACGGGGRKTGGLGAHDAVVVGAGGADDVGTASDDVVVLGGDKVATAGDGVGEVVDEEEEEEEEDKPILVEALL